MKLLIPFILGIVTTVSSWSSYQLIKPDDLSVGTALRTFTSSQLSTTTATDNYVLSTVNGYPVWTASGGGSGSTLHVDGGGFVYPQTGDYHAAPYYTGTSTSATSTFLHASTSYFSLGSDYITDITGTGLTVTGGVLAADLGTSITVGELASADFGDWTCNGSTCTLDNNTVDSAEIVAGAVGTDEIANGAIIEPDLNTDVVAVDGDYLQYDSTGTNFTWRSASEVKTDLSLNNVENTALSTWAGSSNLTTLGVIANGIFASTTSMFQASTSDVVARLFENTGGEYFDIEINASGQLVFADDGGSSFTFSEVGNFTGSGGVIDNFIGAYGNSADFTIYDSNIDEIANFNGVGASAVNYFQLQNSNTGNGITLSALGDDTNIDINLTPKGTGNIVMGAVSRLFSGANPTIDATGEIAFDTTDAQWIGYNGSTEDVFLNEIPRSLGSIGSSSPDRTLATFDTATTTWSLGHVLASSTITQLIANTDTGTCVAVIGDGSATTSAYAITTSSAASTSLSNNTFVPGDMPVLQIGSCASNPNYVTPTVMWAETRQ